MVNKEALRAMAAEQVMQQLQEVKERRRAAIARANDAIKGYEKAVAARDAKIKELREDLFKQLTGIEDEVATLNAAMLQASIAGDGAKADEAQRTLTELEGQRSRLNARLESLSGKPPRCTEEYNNMNEAVAKSEEAEAQYQDDIVTIREICEEMIRPWEKIISALRHAGEAVSRFYLDRARSHYDGEK